MAILENGISKLQRTATRVNIDMLQKDEGNDEGMLPALAENKDDWYCCNCGFKYTFGWQYPYSQNPLCQNPTLMKQACVQCKASASWGRLKGAYKRERTKDEEPALAEYRRPVPSTSASTSKSPALAEDDEVTDWHCVKCGDKQIQKPFEISCSACVASNATFVVKGYKKAKVFLFDWCSAEEPAAESGEESEPDSRMSKNDIEVQRRHALQLAESPGTAPSTTAAVACTSPEPIDAETQNSPGQAASTCRMDAEEATVQHSSPVDTMPSPVVLDLTAHDETQPYDESLPDYDESTLPDYEESQRP